MAPNGLRPRAPGPGAQAPIGRSQLDSIASRVSLDPVDLSARRSTGGALLDGRLQIRHLPAGVEVHVTDAIEMADFTSTVTLAPSLTVSLLLDGEIDAHLGGHHLAFRAGGRTGGAGAPTGRLWTFPRPVTLVRRVRESRRVRKVNVSVPRAWVEDLLNEPADNTGSYLIDGLFTQDVSIRAWSPSAEAVCYAEELLGPHTAGTPIATLSAQMSAIGLLQEALRQAIPEPPSHDGSTLDPRTVERARVARQFITENIDRALALPDIARATGMSVSTLQRVFRACYGISVMEFLRLRRLERARDRLELEGLRVAEAARLAGYNSPANFATAFQRVFGYPPSQHLTRRSR